MSSACVGRVTERVVNSPISFKLSATAKEMPNRVTVVLSLDMYIAIDIFYNDARD